LNAYVTICVHITLQYFGKVSHSSIIAATVLES
jgi:hypothetical protein